jgi:hypothetical protein
MRSGLFVRKTLPHLVLSKNIIGRVKTRKSYEDECAPTRTLPAKTHARHWLSSLKYFPLTFFNLAAVSKAKNDKCLEFIGSFENERFWSNLVKTSYFAELVSLVSTPGIWLGGA